MTVYAEDIAIRLPAPLDWPALSWRPMRREDVPAVYDMLLQIERADSREVVDTLEDAVREFDDPWCNYETDSLLALAPSGRPVAFARTFQNPQPEEEFRCFLWIESHPDQRAGGFEDFLFEWAEARARQRLAAIPGDLRRVIRNGVQDTQADRIALLKRRGYAPVRYFYRMRRDLREPIPDRSLPDGITLRTFTPDLNLAVCAAFNEAFRDHWSYEGVTEEEWQQFFVDRKSFRPDLTFVAMDGDEVAGFSFNTVGQEENARRNIREGWVAELAVRRPWRKRGVATALLYESMRAFRAEGLDYTTLGVDTENPSGALRLYEGVGFKPVKRFIQFEKTP